MTYSYTNDAGEPIMDAAAYRYEQMLDSEYQPDPYDGYDYYDEPEADDPHSCTENTYGREGQWFCDQCDQPLVGTPEDGFAGSEDAYPVDGDDADPMEDQWLDSYMEDRMSGMYEG